MRHRQIRYVVPRFLAHSPLSIDYGEERIINLENSSPAQVEDAVWIFHPALWFRSSLRSFLTLVPLCPSLRKVICLLSDLLLLSKVVSIYKIKFYFVLLILSLFSIFSMHMILFVICM